MIELPIPFLKFTRELAKADRGRDLRADWIVMLASIVKTIWVDNGDVVDVEIEGLGKASARFT